MGSLRVPLSWFGQTVKGPVTSNIQGQKCRSPERIRICQVFAGNIESGTMVGTRSNHWQPGGVIDPSSKR